MSLNGLDEAIINEAYQAALAETGGWFLIRYASRDSVELLSRGNGGVVEVRSTIERYTETSPLYGLVQYRRRKVVLRYVPEGTSRLVQARVTVHFQAVLEKFTPYDTIFSITAATDITETALSSACMLHTSGSFTSSSSSLRRKRLDEIAEDAEEVATEKGTPGKRENYSSIEFEESAGDKTPTKAPPGRSESVPTVAISAPSLPSSPSRKGRGDQSVVDATPEVRVEQENLRRPSDHSAQSSGTKEETSQDGDQDDGESYRQYLQQLSRPAFEPRRSTQSARPSIFDIEKASIYSGYSNYRGKLKRGPRPSLEQHGRPKTSGLSQIRNGDARPVSSLPPGVRFSSRPASHVSQASQITQHPGPPSSAASTTTATLSIDRSTVDHSTVPDYAALAPSNIPQIGEQIHSFYRPPLFAPISSQTVPSSSKPTGITPEKERLMRALQLRRKQQAQHHREREEREGQMPDTVAEEPSNTNRKSVVYHHKMNGPSEPIKTESQRDRGHKNNDSQVSDGKNQLGSAISNGNASDTASTECSSITEVADHSINHQESPGLNTLHSSSSSEEASPPKRVEDKKLKESSPTLSPDPSRPLASVHMKAIDPIAATQKEPPPLSNAEATPLEYDGLPAESPDIASSSPAMSVHDPEESPPRPLTPKRGNTSPHAESPRSNRKPNLSIQIDQSPRTSFSEARPRTAENSRLSSSERLVRRQGVVDPLKNSPISELSNISDEDALMEELQSAKLEEAKPITVARSPATPIFPRGSPDLHRPSLTEIKTSLSPKQLPKPSFAEQKSSSPPQPPSKSPVPLDTPPSKPPMLRSASGRTLPQWPPPSETTPPPLTKKVSVSTGISKRIKALEIFSGRESSTSSSQTQASPTVSSSSRLFKGRMSWTPNHHAPNMTTTTPPSSRFPSTSPATISEQYASGLDRQINGQSPRPSSPKKARESIQVTARIIRGSNQPKLTSQEKGSDPLSLTFHRSPLIVEREKTEPDTISRMPDDRAAPSKNPSNYHERSKIEKHRQSATPTLSAKLSSTDFVPSRLSFSSLGRPKTSEISLARSTSETSSLYNGDEREKKESRRSRIMRRMSNLTSGSRRSVASALSPSSTSRDESLTPTIQENSEALPQPEPEVPHHTVPQHVVDIGDVNVQFPDTLLWKRRFMRVDDQGYLILTPPTMEKNTRNISRKFHLSDVRKPVIPDLDRQELPNSILLDFQDGSCLQCACESRYSQGQVYRMLIDAHAAYNQLYS